MSIFRPLNGARIELDDGSEVDVSAVWDIHILVLDHNDCVFLRLSDAHAEDKLAFLYTNAIEAGREIILSTNAPSVNLAAGTDWQALQPSHFQFGVSADCLRLSSQRITDLSGCTAILARLIRDLARVGGIPMPVLARDSQGRIQAHVPGARRSITPVRTIDAPTTGAAPNGMTTIQQGMQNLAGQVHAAAAAAAANPGAFPPAMAAGLQKLSGGLTGTAIPGSGSAPAPSGAAPAPAPRGGRKPSGKSAPAPTGPVASPFRPAAPGTGFKNPLKNWF